MRGFRESFGLGEEPRQGQMVAHLAVVTRQGLTETLNRSAYVVLFLAHPSESGKTGRRRLWIVAAGSQLVERYMKRCLAYGMFPGFFSHNASKGHYFTRPELYERDRPLFQKYVPLCQRVAEAGWEPVTLARADDEGIYVERYGDKFLTVFNDTGRERRVSISVQMATAGAITDLVSGRAVSLREGQVALSLDAEDVAVLQLHP